MINVIDNVVNSKKAFREMFQKNSVSLREIFATNVIFARNHVFRDTVFHGKVTAQIQFVSNIIGVHEQTIRRIETGRENITIDSAMALCSFYRIPFCYMVMDGGAKHYLHTLENSNGQSKKVSKVSANIQQKDAVIYWDGDIPSMKTSGGKLRQFDLDDCLVWKKHMGGDFVVSFIEDENDSLKRTILHHHIYQPSFRVNGIQYSNEMTKEWLVNPRNCSSVLYISWDASISPQFDVIKSRVFRRLSYYTNATH
jgi:DNA-binding XRE family transcriptional regulator